MYFHSCCLPFLIPYIIVVTDILLPYIECGMFISWMAFIDID